jgi:putative ABC transport system permease protein
MELKYGNLIWSGIWRNRTRTTLTVLSIVVAFLLIGSLQLFSAGLRMVADTLPADRLIVANRYILADQLRISALAQIQSIPGVRVTSHTSYFGGYLGDMKNRVSVTVTTPELFAIKTELHVDPRELRAFAQIPIGALVGRRLADKWGWHVGSRIVVRSRYFATRERTYDWPLEVVGIFDGGAPAEQATLYMNFHYFDEARIANLGRVDQFVVSVADPGQADVVARAIDARFANSDRETLTTSEQEIFSSQLRRLGNIQLVVAGIVGAVLFTLTYLTGNVLMLSFRERRAELATLKAVGFTDRCVFLLISSEALLIVVVAAALGLVAAIVLLLFLSSYFPVKLSAGPLLFAVAAAILLALGAAAAPAWHARQLSVAAALARR